MAAQMYSLFERDGKRWKQVSDYVSSKRNCITVFQGRLLARSLGQPGPELRIRPLTPAQLREHEERIDALVAKADAIVEGP